MNRPLTGLLADAIAGDGDFQVTHEEADRLRAWEKAPIYFYVDPEGKERFCGRLVVEVDGSREAAAMNRVWIVLADEYAQQFVHSVYDSKEKADAQVAKDPNYYQLDSEEGEEVK